MAPIAFVTSALALCIALFGDALWGRSMLAPIDIAAAQWPQYSFVDPDSNRIPRNHYIVDQLSYDLPLQWTVYHAWRRGEVPWWDPYTYGGRPLAADAHVSAFDPIRIACYLAFSRFEIAYHWVPALHFLAGGLGIFCLLRRFSLSLPVAAGAGLVGMVAGSNVVNFGHPWLHATFLYYPWLWLAWHAAWKEARVWGQLAAPLLAACAIYAGNLQSHAYLVVFGIAFCIGYGGRRTGAWIRALAIVVPTGIIAALLAAPVLMPELELFSRSERVVTAAASGFRWFEAPLVASALWPWSAGTFRSLSLSITGFQTFIGTAGFLLAVLSVWKVRDQRPDLAEARRFGITLVASFIAILLVPILAQMLYVRASGLAVLGGIVLAALAAENLRNQNAQHRRLAWAMVGLAFAIALGTAAVAHLVYPRLAAQLTARMEAHAQVDGSEGRSLPLRRFQASNYPREIGFTNPEVMAAWLCLPLAALVLAVPRWRRWSIPALLVLNLGAPVLFARRFIPRVPIEQWNRLLAGGPLQQQAASLLKSRSLRLEERGSGPFGGIFPAGLAHLYGVHVPHGYAALVVPNMAWSNSIVADYRFHDGSFEQVRAAGDARFSWLGQPGRTVTTVGESLNSITLRIGDGPAGWLLRTDTRYPGWRAFDRMNHSLEMQAEDRLFSKIAIPAGPSEVRLVYRPTSHMLALGLAVGGMLGLAGWITALKRRSRLSTSAPTL